MSDKAKAFLDTWAVQEEHHGALSDADAAMVAERWEMEAAENGISAADLRAAADGDVAAFLQRIFGRAGSEFTLE